MSLATRHGPLWPHRKSSMPGGDTYMIRLAVSLGRRQARREDFIAQARRSTDMRDRAFYVARARDWHKLCMEELRLMRQEERVTA